jgi:hypothetical protein
MTQERSNTNTKRIRHTITLPREQALMWYEVLAELEFSATRFDNQVTAHGTQEDLETAWQLFHEKFSLICGGGSLS